MESLTEFHRFPKLPQELQDMVWKHASHLVPPRVVTVLHRKQKALPRDQRFVTNSPCPVLLHVCKASRQIMLKNWPLCFGFRKRDAQIPFNFAIDTLYFEDTLFSVTGSLNAFDLLVSLNERVRIERIAWQVEIYVGNQFHETYESIGKMLNTGFPNLKKLFWIGGDQARESEEEVGFEVRRYYKNAWALRLARIESMLPHYLHLEGMFSETLLEKEEKLRIENGMGVWDDVYDHFTAWNRPEVEFSKIRIRVVGVEDDPWGYKMGKDPEEAETTEEKTRIVAGRKAEVHRLHEERKTRLERIQMEAARPK